MYQWQAKAAAGRLSSRADFLKVSDGIAASLRQFSISARAAAEEKDTPKSKLVIRRVSDDTPSRTPNQDNRPRPTQTPGSGAPRSLDARSLGAARGGANVLRGSGMLLRGGFRGRGGGLRGGPSRGGGRGGAAGPRGGSGPRASARDEAAARRKVKQAAKDDGAESEELSPEIKQYMLEKQERERPVPIDYEPAQNTLESLAEDWPALPTASSEIAVSARAVEDRIAYLSKRYAHSHEPVEYLAERYYDGELIAFASEEEKNEVLQIVGEMSAKRAEKLSKRKSEEIKPEDHSFEALSAEGQKLLLNSSLKGDYPQSQQLAAGKTPLVGELLRNLTNNGTYNSEDMQKFMAKIQDMVPAKAQGAIKGKSAPTAAKR